MSITGQLTRPAHYTPVQEQLIKASDLEALRRDNVRLHDLNSDLTQMIANLKEQASEDDQPYRKMIKDIAVYVGIKLHDPILDLSLVYPSLIRLVNDLEARIQALKR